MPLMHTSAIIAISTDGHSKFEAFYGNPAFREGMLKLAFEHFLQVTTVVDPIEETTT